jgi:hypothetical protein
MKCIPSVDSPPGPRFVRSVNNIVVVVLHTELSEAFLQSLGEHVDLTLGFSKGVAILLTLLLAFLCLEESVTGSKNAFGSCASLRPLTPERKRFVRCQLRGPSGDNLFPRDVVRPRV